MAIAKVVLPQPDYPIRLMVTLGTRGSRIGNGNKSPFLLLILP